MNVRNFIPHGKGFPEDIKKSNLDLKGNQSPFIPI